MMSLIKLYCYSTCRELCHARRQVELAGGIHPHLYVHFASNFTESKELIPYSFRQACMQLLQ